MAGLFGAQPDKKIMSWRVPIPIPVADEIRYRAKRGRSLETKHDTGGYQSLVFDLEDRLDGLYLEVDYLVLGRMFRYAYTPSGGGWEDSLQAILLHCRRFFTTEHE